MNHLRSYEGYNNDKLNQLIKEHFPSDSEEIIKIINTYQEGSKKEIENIFNKLSFIMEEGDVDTILDNNDEILAYYINLGSNKTTIFYDFEKEKFRVTTKKNF